MEISDAERQRVINGCRCRDCWGLAEVMIQMHGDDFGLERAPGHPTMMRLRITTGGVPEAVTCDSSMTCGCERCVGEREARAARAAETRQPWEPRPARVRSAP
jgi:hypothetical protein